MAAVITALGIIFGGVYATYKIVHRIGEVLGLDRHGRTISERLDRVEHQLWENGGSSLADKVANIELNVTRVAAELDVIRDMTVSIKTATSPEKPKRIRKAS